MHYRKCFYRKYFLKLYRRKYLVLKNKIKFHGVIRILGRKKGICIGALKDKGRNISNAQMTSDPICQTTEFGFKFIESSIVEHFIIFSFSFRNEHTSKKVVYEFEGGKNGAIKINYSPVILLMLSYNSY